MIPMNVILRSEGDPLSLSNALRAEVRRVDPMAPLFGVDSMTRMLDANTAGARWNTFLVGGFAVLALLLGAVGTYGVLAYAVTLRRREIGVRMALGAAASDVIWLVVREGMTVALLGIASGIALALVLGRLATTLLFKVSPHDPAAFTAVAIALAMVALAATLVPARRAAQVDPVSTLRAE
jgi:putative ABC transport system permease protein